MDVGHQACLHARHELATILSKVVEGHWWCDVFGDQASDDVDDALVHPSPTQLPIVGVVVQDFGVHMGEHVVAEVFIEEDMVNHRFPLQRLFEHALEKGRANCAAGFHSLGESCSINEVHFHGNAAFKASIAGEVRGDHAHDIIVDVEHLLQVGDHQLHGLRGLLVVLGIEVGGSRGVWEDQGHPFPGVDHHVPRARDVLLVVLELHDLESRASAAWGKIRGGGAEELELPATGHPATHKDGPILGAGPSDRKMLGGLCAREALAGLSSAEGPNEARGLICAFGGHWIRKAGDKAMAIRLPQLLRPVQVVVAGLWEEGPVNPPGSRRPHAQGGSPAGLASTPGLIHQKGLCRLLRLRSANGIRPGYAAKIHAVLFACHEDPGLPCQLRIKGRRRRGCGRDVETTDLFCCGSCHPGIGLLGIYTVAKVGGPHIGEGNIVRGAVEIKFGDGIVRTAPLVSLDFGHGIRLIQLVGDAFPNLRGAGTRHPLRGQVTVEGALGGPRPVLAVGACGALPSS
mmetsp:Transcript_120288/g.285819  ORF Transcript_120288/g.285819 Transcript_120288/m.285819 type:complete len:515 (+) Transcript_120288:377-1921(+)